MQKSVKWWLLGIFFLTAAVRLFFAYTQPELTYESYYHLRQVEYITEHGFPSFHDPLSYGGRDTIFLPFFHYSMALFNLFLPLSIIASVIPNLLIASLTIIAFFIARKITADEQSSLAAAFVTGFLPILYNTTNSFTPETLFLPLIFLTVYAFLNLENQKYIPLYIILFFAVTLTSAATALLLVGFVIYLLLSYAESKKLQKAEIELILFSIFFYLWIEFLFFKNVLLQEGIFFIWQNIPLAIYKDYFPKITLVQALVSVSIVPFLAGIFTVYKLLFQLKNSKAFLLISYVISTTLLTWLGVISFRLSLAFFGITLGILFALSYKNFLDFIKKTKIAHLHSSITLILTITLLLTMLIPIVSITSASEHPTSEEISAFQWIHENTPKNAGIAAPLPEGHLVTYISKRRNLVDDHFSLADDAEQRFRDVNTIFKTTFQTEALGLLEKYHLDYIIFTPTAQQLYGKQTLAYEDNNCVKQIYNQTVKIYRVRCILKGINFRTN